MAVAPTQKHKVLWADDDADDLMIMREIVEIGYDDHEVIEASNGRDALTRLSHLHLSSELPCLIILDINMPVLNGFETLEVLKSHPVFASIPVVLFTTSDSEREHELCKKYDVKLYTKPHNYRDYQKVIQTLLSHCGKISAGAV